MFRFRVRRRQPHSESDDVQGLGTEEGLDRRGMLRAGAIAAAGAAVGTVLGAAPADAAAGDNMVLGAANDSGVSTTSLASSASAGALKVSSGSGGPALRATGNTVPSGGAVAVAGNAAALSVEGVMAMTRSGALTFPAGTQVMDVSVPGGLTFFSWAFAMTQAPTIQKNPFTNNVPPAGGAHPDRTTGKVTIWLQYAVPYPVKVAWFVLG